MVYLPMGADLGGHPWLCPAASARPGSQRRTSRATLDPFRALIPDADEFRIERFILAQDGRTDTLAFVATLDDQGRSWEYGINLQDLNLLERSVFEELLSTIIHEYAHILTLNETQVTYDSDLLEFYTDMEMSDAEYEALLTRSSRLRRSIGCPRRRGLLHAGQLPVRVLSRVLGLVRRRRAGAGLQATLFEEYEADFVNDYAATSPTEDFAETFAAWLMPEHEAFLITETVEDKFAFFESQPELMALRAQIEAGLEEVRAARLF